VGRWSQNRTNYSCVAVASWLKWHSGSQLHQCFIFLATKGLEWLALSIHSSICWTAEVKLFW